MLPVERDLHMVAGHGETSYAKNSRLQEKAILMAKPVLEKAVIEVYCALLPKTMVVADLGCSSGPNTLLFVSEVINAIAAQPNNEHGRHAPMELQFFLNDLPGNDFNNLFNLLEQFKKSTGQTNRDGEGTVPPPYYISGLPGSFYTRIFPRKTVHLFHSSSSLHWRSQVPEGLTSNTAGVYLNEGNIFITKAASPLVVKMFREQFEKDFSLFLRLRHEELVPGGQMVHMFLARKNEDVFSGDFNHLLELLAQSLQTLVDEGLVEKEKLDSFNVPMYQPSLGEVKAIVNQSELFFLDHVQFFEANWDPYDDSEGEIVHDSVQSGVNVSKYIRSVFESMISSHFGEAILDPIFTEFARRVAKHLDREKTKHVAVVISLKKR